MCFIIHNISAKFGFNIGAVDHDAPYVWYKVVYVFVHKESVLFKNFVLQWLGFM
jgi:hypothetical protein